MRLKLSQPSLAGVGAGAELGKILIITPFSKFRLHEKFQLSRLSRGTLMLRSRVGGSEAQGLIIGGARAYHKRRKGLSLPG